jgi:hypothetical protein
MHLPGIGHRHRSGVRLWAHLPRWRYSPRSWSLAVVVEEAETFLKEIEAIDHRPAFVALSPGHHKLDVKVTWFLRTLTTLRVAVDLDVDEVVDLELVRPRRRSIGRRNLPTEVRVRD